VTKDQKHIAELFLPLLTERVYSDKSEAAALDATILNRAMLQGPDPLFLMETCPEQFLRLCMDLNISDIEWSENRPVSCPSARSAIERAHNQGPGVLLQGTGLPLDGKDIRVTSDVLEAWKLEALWLVLVSFSDCTEGGYTPDVSLLERFQRVATATAKFESALAAYRISGWRNNGGQVEVRDGLLDAFASARKFIATTTFTLDERGFPHTDVDHGFYVAYKQGHKVCAVKQGGLTFWGTVSETSLEEQGIVVDKVLSPTFGIVFPKETS
jgi:hypothetical protein